MSKQASFIRHRIIIQKLKSKPSTFDEILDKLEDESYWNNHDLSISKRTFQRDLNEIQNIYGIEIKYDRKLRAYRIYDDKRDEYSERLFEAIDMMQVLKFKQLFSKYIQFDSREPLGTEHLSDLLLATQKRKQIQFRYKKFKDDKVETRTFEPYLLKEFRKRWYVFGFDVDKKKMRTFGLDRISLVQITSKKFQFPQKINPKLHFKNSFGIMDPGNNEPETILLKFKNGQGDYIKTMPLHWSQKIIEENKDKMLIELNLIPNLDFIMELLFYGENVKVLQPSSLAEKVTNHLKNAVSLYETD